MEQSTHWIPTPHDLLAGNPFPYSSRAISVISATEAFNTGIDHRDQGRCVVCGDKPSIEHCQIIPKVDSKTWEEMRQWGFVPGRAKSVEHEARNGMLLCKNHHHTFDNFFYYIRWTPEIRRFVLIDHSQEPGPEQWHGKAINLLAGDDRLPFYGSFLVHEERVRGWWPFRTDRPIRMPILPQDWIPSDEDNDDNGDDRHHHKNPDIANQGDHHSTLPGGIHTGPLPVASNVRHEHHDPPSTNTASRQQPKTFTPTDPFANPAELEALVASFPKQPSWKAAVREGETWDGTAEENIAKWQGLTGGPSG